MSAPSPAAPVLPEELLAVFGSGDDPIQVVESRARARFPDRSLIVWEGNPQTFAFSYVGGDAELLLGHAAESWVREGSFWVDHVVHPDDRRDAVAYCALATGKCSDHLFEYRARHVDGSVVWLLDYVNVVIGARGIPVRLRGVMIDITAAKCDAGSSADAPTLRSPTPAELERMAG